jgi:hypothetical protein
MASFGILAITTYYIYVMVDSVKRRFFSEEKSDVHDEFYEEMKANKDK